MSCNDKTPAPSSNKVYTSLAEYFLGSWQDLGQSYDYIVIGGGAYGTAFARQMLALSQTARVLILEKGTVFFPDHSQNLPASYVDAVYGAAASPWICEGDFFLAPQQPYLGGRALFWNAWVPQPRAFEFPDWPEAAVTQMNPEWYPANEMIGRRFSLACDGNDNATLDSIAKGRLFAGNDTIACAVPLTTPADLESAMATGAGVSPGQFAKYAPVAHLTALVQAYPDRLKVVPLTTVTHMRAENGRIAELTLAATTGEAVTTLNVGTAQLILANNTIEAASLALTAFPDHPLLGKNLCVHNRSSLAFRIPVGQFPHIAEQLQVCGYYQLSQIDRQRFFHNHISVVYNPDPQADNDLLYRILPDASSAQSLAMYQQTGYVYVLVQALGEVLGERSRASWNHVSRSGEQTLVTIKAREADKQAWEVMDRSVFDIVRVLAKGAAVEYMHAPSDQPMAISWRAEPPAQICSRMVFHEAGTLWMGDDPAESVTDTRGKMHGVANLYGTGSMLFPSPGSWNPTFAGIAMTFALARHLATEQPR